MRQHDCSRETALSTDVNVHVCLALTFCAHICCAHIIHTCDCCSCCLHRQRALDVCVSGMRRVVETIAIIVLGIACFHLKDHMRTRCTRTAHAQCLRNVLLQRRADQCAQSTRPCVRVECAVPDPCNIPKLARATPSDFSVEQTQPRRCALQPVDFICIRFSIVSTPLITLDVSN